MNLSRAFTSSQLFESELYSVWYRPVYQSLKKCLSCLTICYQLKQWCNIAEEVIVSPAHVLKLYFEKAWPNHIEGACQVIVVSVQQRLKFFVILSLTYY